MVDYVKAERPRFTETSIEVPSHHFNHPICHQYDASGWHRLQINGRVGDWTYYSDIATIKIHRDDKPHIEVIIAATTEYWWPELPEIFEIVPIKKHELPT